MHNSVKRANPFANPGSAERRRKAREAAGLSRWQAAKEIGTDRFTVEYWERFERHPTRKQLECMAARYDVSLAYLRKGKLICFADVLAEYHDAPEEIQLDAMKQWSMAHPER